jgi:hypothetical protein
MQYRAWAWEALGAEGRVEWGCGIFDRSSLLDGSEVQFSKKIRQGTTTANAAMKREFTIMA